MSKLRHRSRLSKFRFVVLTLSVLVFATTLLQVSSAKVDKMPSDVRAALDALPQARVVASGSDQVPTFIEGDLGRLQTNARDEIRAALEVPLQKIARAFRLDAGNLSLLRIDQDDLGMTHVRYRQFKNGLEVVGGDLTVHVDKEGTVYAVNGTARDGVDIKAIPDISAKEARALALSLRGGYLLSAGKPRLTYMISNIDRSMHLAYEVTAEGTAPDGGPVRDLIYIDANNGKPVDIHPQIHSALNRRIYSANNDGFLPGTLKRSEGGPPDSDPLINTNYDHMGTTYNFYRSVLNRDSFDGLGSAQFSSVHFRQNYNDAHWDGTQVLFGDGDGVRWSPLGGALDIVAHEFTHGVTNTTSDLFASGESGAINEAMSDIFGAAVEAFDRGVSANTWQFGEDAFTPGTLGDALRYMDNPARDGISRDYYPDRFPDDLLSVHFNAGIANLAFYLMANGGPHPRGRTPVIVPAIGLGAAEQIFYRANSFYLTRSSNFQDARLATARASKDFQNAAAFLAVHKAWDAVGVPGGLLPDDSLVVSQVIPATMTAGQAYSVSVTAANVGTNTWFPGDYYLASADPGRWGIDRVDFGGAGVAPEAQRTFTFTVIAPAVAGTYTFRWDMARNGIGLFGDSSGAQVNVLPAADNAEFVSQSVPANMVPSQNYAVFITMKNLGPSIWTAAGGHQLGSQNPENNTIWGVNRVTVPTNVAAGSSVTFDFQVTAPSTPGIYNFQWRMARAPAVWFGQFTPNVMVNVGGVPASPANLSAAVASNSRIDLSWTDLSTNETGFKVERKTGGGAFTQIATVGANVKNFSNTGLAPLTNYCYQVRAFTANGNSGYTNQACASTPDQPPAAPSNLTASLGCNDIVLYWSDNSSNEQGFIIERREGSFGAFTELTRVDANQNVAVDEGLSPIYTYFYYRIRAYNAAGTSSPSNEVFIFTQCGEESSQALAAPNGELSPKHLPRPVASLPTRWSTPIERVDTGKHRTEGWSRAWQFDIAESKISAVMSRSGWSRAAVGSQPRT